MKVKTKIQVKEDNIIVDENIEGIVKAGCSYEGKGYFYLVQFPDVKIPILVKMDDLIITDKSSEIESDSKQIDKSEKEFEEMKKEKRKINRENKKRNILI
jgi:hypothetical protein